MKIVVLAFAGLAGFILLIFFGSKILYQIGIYLHWLSIKISSPIKIKSRQWLSGRKDLFKNLELNFNFPNHKKIWFHCASLGEFEQCKTLIEKMRANFPNHKFLLTFYSPSGYIEKKNYDQVDYVTYLPLDTKSNATQWVEKINPDLVFFVKYEYWINHLNALKNKRVPVILFSAIFRKKNIFFRWYGKIFKSALKDYKQIFVQDEESKTILNKYKIQNVTVAFDTRVDRVLESLLANKEVPFLKDFCSEFDILVAGSTWRSDELILADAFYHSIVYHNFKLIVVPHDVNKRTLSRVQRIFKKYCILYSQISNESKESMQSKRVLIVDNVGTLSQIYKYATVAYVGGGFNKGVHNVLEAAVFGKPIFIGPKYKKFQEIVDLIKIGSIFPIVDPEELKRDLNLMSNIESFYNLASGNAKKYVLEKGGGTEIILNYTRSILLNQ